EASLGTQRVAAMLVVPADFDDEALRNRGVLELHLDNVNIDLADDIRRSSTRSVAQMDAPDLGAEAENAAVPRETVLRNQYRVGVIEVNRRASTVSFLAYQVTTILVLIVFSLGLIGTAIVTGRYFALGTLLCIMSETCG